MVTGKDNKSLQIQLKNDIMFKTGSLIKVIAKHMVLYHKAKALPKVLERDEIFLILNDQPYSGREINKSNSHIKEAVVAFSPECDFYLVLYQNDLYHLCAESHAQVTLFFYDYNT